MWRFVLCLFAVALGGCNAPSPHFAGAQPTRIAVDGSVFDVRVRGALAESIRVNDQYAPRLGPIGPRAALAMERVSGCRVTRVLGDQAQQLGQLDCGTGTPSPPLRPTPRYDCMEIPSGVGRGDGYEYLDYDCSPVL